MKRVKLGYVDTSTAMGKAYLGLAWTFAEWERNTFMGKAVMRLEKAVKKGKWAGGIVPYISHTYT